MCFNLGKADKIIRTIVGLGLIGYGVISQNYIIAAVGAVPLLTAAIGFCPIYTMLKLDSGCKK